MIRIVKTRGIFGALTLAIAVLPQPSTAYPIDCAILLCMSGGFPPSAVCAAAKAEVIRRITPVPVEPPLQIWRCPMNVSFQRSPDTSPMERIYNVSFNLGSAKLAPLNPQGRTSLPNTLTPALRPAVLRAQNLQTDNEWRVQSSPKGNGTADIDISGPEFAFARSITVWHVWYHFHQPAGEQRTCRQGHTINRGTYGNQGQYIWKYVTPEEVPSWVGLDLKCSENNHIAARIGMSWQDSNGAEYHEIINYAE